MSTSVATHCPDCKAEISPDLRSCVECGADVGQWPESQRTPLILPGNPALSVDVVRKRVSVPRIALGSTAVLAVVGLVLFYMPEQESEDLTRVVAVATDADSPSSPPPANSAAASSPRAEALVADSLAAFSYGDTAVTRAVPSAAARTVPVPVRTSAPVASAPERRSMPATPAPRPAEPARRIAPSTPRAETPRPAARVAAATRTPAPATPARPTVTPVLTLTPVVSTSLRSGERLQLRWDVTDRTTRRAIPRARVEFTSTDATVATVNATSGLVVARAPGAARIIIDAGAAGQRTVSLTVRAPAPAPTVAVTTPTPDLSRNPAATSPPPAATAAPAANPARETAGSALPDAAEVRTVVDRFIRDVRRDAVRNFEVTQFLADGADHRVTLMRGPNVLSSTGMGVRVTFDMRFTKFDGGGRPVTRVAAVTMDVDKRDGQPSSSAVAIGALRRR